MSDENALTAQVKWVDGLQFVGHGDKSAGTFTLDGAPESGGANGGVRPVEALLIALGGCTGMDVISILRKKRQRVTAFRVNLRGLRASEHPRRFVRIEVEFVVRGWQIDPRAVERSIELSRTKYCSVTASLNAEMVHTYRVEQEQTQEQ